MKYIKKFILIFLSVGIVTLAFLSTHQPNAVKPEQSKETEVDYDLSKLSGNVVYSQVYAMMKNPEEYVDKTFKISGVFALGKDKDGNTMYGCIIKDALGCCQQGIQFQWEGNHKYPDDYPDLGTEITVVGTFSYQKDGNIVSLLLKNAEMKVGS